jgi:transketolase
MVSDGDLMEGVASEAASLAGHLRLGRLICLYDNNHITLSGETRLTFTEDVCKRFEAYGWHVQSVDDGNDIEAISKAIIAAKNETIRPSFISVRTHIGYGSPHKQDTFEVHGSPLGTEEIVATKKNLGWPIEPKFYIPEDALAQFKKALDKGIQLEATWKTKMGLYEKTYPKLMNEWNQMMSSKPPDGWDHGIPVFPPDPKGIATRSACGQIMNATASQVPSLIGGSGDLNPSTYTVLNGLGNFQYPQSEDREVQGAVSGEWGYGGANIAFGVREHAMGSIVNGIALHGGLLPFGSTFLVFSDYMRPAIRLAALMKIHVIYVFTHDSVGIGEDGPTHQPIEHLSSLREIPNLIVLRPADANEMAEAWRVAIQHKDGPVAITLTRQKVPVIDRGKFNQAVGLRRGAYILADSAFGKPEIILIATGSEIYLALEVHEKMQAEGIRSRVVSMPSWELFEEQSEEYRNEVLPPDSKTRISIEAGSTHGWHKYVGLEGAKIGIDHFGDSAAGEVLLKKFGFTSENILNRAKTLLAKKKG